MVLITKGFLRLHKLDIPAHCTQRYPYVSCYVSIKQGLIGIKLPILTNAHRRVNSNNQDCICHISTARRSQMSQASKFSDDK